jgi:hypothetical protein
MLGKAGSISDSSVTAPAGLGFGALRLVRRPGNVIAFDDQVLLHIWVSSGFHAELLYKANAAVICTFIARWHAAYLKTGGLSDPDQDELISYIWDNRASLYVVPL